jgi:hypothetical protein
MVYDVTNAGSFEHVEEWMLEINRHASASTIKLLIGNKADLVTSKAVSEEDAKKYAEAKGISRLETSAKNSTNVEAAFLTMARFSAQLSVFLSRIYKFSGSWLQQESLRTNPVMRKQDFLYKAALIPHLDRNHAVNVHTDCFTATLVKIDEH